MICRVTACHGGRLREGHPSIAIRAGSGEQDYSGSSFVAGFDRPLTDRGAFRAFSVRSLRSRFEGAVSGRKNMGVLEAVPAAEGESALANRSGKRMPIPRAKKTANKPPSKTALKKAAALKAAEPEVEQAWLSRSMKFARHAWCRL